MKEVGANTLRLKKILQELARDETWRSQCVLIDWDNFLTLKNANKIVFSSFKQNFVLPLYLEIIKEVWRLKN